MGWLSPPANLIPGNLTKQPGRVQPDEDRRAECLMVAFGGSAVGAFVPMGAKGTPAEDRFRSMRRESLVDITHFLSTEPGQIEAWWHG